MKPFIKITAVAFAVFGCETATAQTTTDSLQLRSSGNLVKLLAQPSTAAYSIQLPASVPAQRQFLGVSSVSGTTGIGAWMDSTAFKNTYWSLTGNTGTTPSTSTYGNPVNNNFIGTTDQKDWVVATNNLERMRVLSGTTANTAGDVVVGTQTAATVASGSSNSTAAQQLARLTVSGGDANINGVTVGMGGGQDAGSVAIGAQAIYNNTMGYFNTAIGYQALYNNTEGGENAAVGYQALLANTTGNDNVALGTSALISNTTGYSNTAIGTMANDWNTTGNNNTAIGFGVMSNSGGSTGSGNTAIGMGALFNTNSGSHNTVIGENAGNTITSGSRNIVIGGGGGTSAAPMQNVPSPTGSNQLNIGGVIFGTGMTGNEAAPAGNIGINTSLPSSTLTVNGSFAGQYRIVTASTTIGATDFYVAYNGSAAGTITLPAATAAAPAAGNTLGRIYHIKNTSTVALTVAANGSELIDWTGTTGLSTFTVPVGGYAMIISKGTTGATTTWELVLLYAPTSITTIACVSASDGVTYTGQALTDFNAGIPQVIPFRTTTYPANLIINQGGSAVWNDAGSYWDIKESGVYKLEAYAYFGSLNAVSPYITVYRSTTAGTTFTAAGSEYKYTNAFIGINLNITKNGTTNTNIIGGTRANIDNVTAGVGNSQINTSCIVHLDVGDKIYLTMNLGFGSSAVGDAHINTPNYLKQNRYFSLQQLSTP